MRRVEERSGPETAVCMGMDALRICIGHKPRNYSSKDVMRWMRLMLRAQLSENSNAR